MICITHEREMVLVLLPVLAIKFFIILNPIAPSPATFGRRGKQDKYTELFCCFRLMHTYFDDKKSGEVRFSSSKWEI